jgi:RHS repeat-associated protein
MGCVGLDSHYRCREATDPSIAVDGTPISWTYAYDSSAHLHTVSEGGGVWRTYNYAGTLTEVLDASGNLIESHAYGGGATSSLGQTDDVTNVTYSIDTADPDMKITRVTYATGAQTLYYTSSIAGQRRVDHIEGACPSCGKRDAVYAYDIRGRVTREQDARGYIADRAYDDLGRMTSETSALVPTGCDPESDSRKCRRVGTLGTVALSATAASITRTYAYGDAQLYDRPLSITTTSVLNPSGAHVETMTYDPQTAQILTRAAVGWTGSAESPQMETQTSLTTLYDGVQSAAFNPGGGFAAAWLSLVQPVGLRKSYDGPRTDVVDANTWVYYPIDSTVPATWRGRLAAVRNAAGHITRFENYDAFGNAGRTIDPNGVIAESSFDSIGRLVTSTLKAVAGCDTTADPLCATDIVSSRSYQPTLGLVVSTTTPRGGTTTYEYDNRGRTTATTRQVSAIAYERIEYDYDPATGHKSAERYLGGHPGAWTITRSDAFQYDSFARLSEIDHPDGSKIVYHYDGANNVISVQDERHTAPNTTYGYDPANRLTSVTQTLSTAPGNQIATAYAYDIQGNLTSVTDPNGNVTSYVHDDFGRMLQQTSPVTGVTNYTYDEAGNLMSTTDANAATTMRSYDALGRVLTAISSRDSDTQHVTWTYDDATAENYGISRLASAMSDDSSTTYHYDRRGLLREEVFSIEGDPFVQSYGYDADGNRTTLSYPSGRIANYTFDFVGRPMGVTGSMSGSPTPYVTSASYLPFGPMTSLTFGNGTAETRTFDQKYSAATAQLSTASSLLANYTYAADGAGNITQINDLTDSGYNRTFGYDDVNRLVTANSGASLWGTGGYTYDSMGNMMTSTLGSKVRSFTYAGTAPLINTVSTDGTVTNMQYDAAGNELNGPAGASAIFISDTRTYSPRNLLQQADLTEPAHYCRGPQRGETCTGGWVLQRTSTLWNGYDARGVRVVSMQSSSAGGFPDMKFYFYAPELTQMATFAPNDGIESDVIWFAGRPVASGTTAAPDPRFTFTDHLGTPVLQTDALANVVWRAEYEPFGNVFAMRAGGANDQRLRLPGQQVAFTNFAGDEENYNIFRWYRSGWGRYTQADPIGIGGGTTLNLNHLYGYAGSNPITDYDPTGLYKVGSTCDDKLCGPCIDQLFRKMRDTIRSNKKCQRALNSFGGTFNAADLIRSSFRGTPGPTVTCNRDDCNPSKFGGRSEPHYSPFGGGTIPACLSLYDGENSLMHEVLHYFGVGDDTAQQYVILKNCYSNSVP